MLDWPDLEEFCKGNNSAEKNKNDSMDDSEFRRKFLTQILSNWGIPFKELTIKGFTHLFISGPHLPSSGSHRPKIFISHYDRVPGTPGANDNSASVFHLLLWLQKHYLKVTSDVPFAIIFTDGEEVYPPRRPETQGSRNLGDFLKHTPWGQALFIVLDMTGIGDTPILSSGTESQLKHFMKDEVPLDLLKQIEVQRMHARKMLAGVRGGFYIELPTPFSDDLGLLLSGIPALQITLLPRKQALEAKKNGISRQQLPLAWNSMHSPIDTPDTLDPESRPLMQNLISAVMGYPLPALPS